MKKHILVMAAFAAVTFIASAGEAPVAATASAHHGQRTCSTCQTTWVRTPVTINKTTFFQKTQKTGCPDCKSALANFVQTGKLTHTCNACGDQPMTCSHCS